MYGDTVADLFLFYGSFHGVGAKTEWQYGICSAVNDHCAGSAVQYEPYGMATA